MDGMRESDLYEPIKNYLEALGYDVKAEVKDCDVAAVRGEELIVVELKKGFTLEVVYQALRRQRLADSVYIAVPLPKRGYMAPRYKDTLQLCKQLELGLIFVGFTTAGQPQVDVAVHPQEPKPPRKNPKKRKVLLAEHAGRTGSHNTGGVTRRKILTVYKENALSVASILKCHGSLKAADIRKLGGPENTSAILGRNFYKWYAKCETTDKGYPSYQVTERGLEALDEYADLFT